MENIIRQKLEEALKPLTLEIRDESYLHKSHAGFIPGKSTHFNVKVVSKAFTSLSRLERHRLVNRILETELKEHIHALSLDLHSPNEINGQI